MNIVIRLNENEVQRLLNGSEIVFPLKLQNGTVNVANIIVKRKEGF